MNDADFLTAVREYIEAMEDFQQQERGQGHDTATLIARGLMPKIHTEVLRRLDDVAPTQQRIKALEAENQRLASLLREVKPLKEAP